MHEINEMQTTEATMSSTIDFVKPRMVGSLNTGKVAAGAAATGEAADDSALEKSVVLRERRLLVLLVLERD